MRSGLAEKLLIELMEWEPSEVAVERPLLQALSNLKYNEYQQFSIGTLFIQSLVKWLGQFDNSAERKIAYSFIKRKLIFFSNNQILHLVNSTFSKVINPLLVKKTALNLGISRYKISAITTNNKFKNISRKCLYIGLSDGSRIDQLRRVSKLNNEQVIPTYDINLAKVKDLLCELHKELPNEKFDTIFLVDDFTASGTSYMRENPEGKLEGKIYKTIKNFMEVDGSLNTLINPKEPLEIHLIFYISTEEARDKISSLIKKMQKEFTTILIEIHVLQLIENVTKDKILSDEIEFIELSKKYINKSIVDSHWKKAKHDKYYLGYNECSLPIVLGHNTPNNSLPLIWWINKEETFSGLFPRITRHS